MPPGADFQFADLNWAYGGADELQDFAADDFHHSPYLTIAAFADPDFDVGVLAGIAHSFHFGRASGAVA